MGPLHITLPAGEAALPRPEAEFLAGRLRAFGPPDEMPSAHSAAAKISALLTGQAGQERFTCSEQYEILLALDRLGSSGAEWTSEAKGLRQLLALQFAWRAQQEEATRTATSADA